MTLSIQQLTKKDNSLISAFLLDSDTQGIRPLRLLNDNLEINNYQNILEINDSILLLGLISDELEGIAVLIKNPFYPSYFLNLISYKGSLTLEFCIDNLKDFCKIRGIFNIVCLFKSPILLNNFQQYELERIAPHKLSNYEMFTEFLFSKCPVDYPTIVYSLELNNNLR